LRVLLVAPRKNDLHAVDEEIQDIYRSGLQVTPIVGKVTAAELAREIRGGEFDVLWLATHGDDSGIELSGLERISASELVPMVRGRFSLVVLNTCNGLGIAQMLQEEANVGVICALVGIGDSVAYQFGSRLATALVETDSIADAYLASKPGRNANYLHLPALRQTQQSIDNLLMELKNLKAEIERLRAEMQLERARERRQERRWWLMVATLLVVFYPAAWLLMWAIIGRL